VRGRRDRSLESPPYLCSTPGDWEHPYGGHWDQLEKNNPNQLSVSLASASYVEMMYSPAVSFPQRLHLHCAPPAIQVHHGFTYPRQPEHRAGPDSEVGTSGTGSSRGSRSANGWRIIASGTSQSRTSFEDEGTAHVVGRANFGFALPTVSIRMEAQRERTEETHPGRALQSRWSRVVHGCLEMAE
jgi:hypothetical protein